MLLAITAGCLILTVIAFIIASEAVERAEKAGQIANNAMNDLAESAKWHTALRNDFNKLVEGLGYMFIDTPAAPSERKLYKIAPHSRK